MHVGCACLSLVRSGADRALKQWSTIELPKYASHFWLGTHINREIEPCAIDEGKAAHGPTLAAGHSRVPLYSASLTCSLTHSLALFVCHTQAKSWWCWRSSWRSTQSGATEDLRNCLSWRAESRSRRRRRRSKRSLSEGSAHLLGTDCVWVCVCVLCLVVGLGHVRRLQTMATLVPLPLPLLLPQPQACPFVRLND